MTNNRPWQRIGCSSQLDSVFKGEIGRIRVAVGEEEELHASVRMRAELLEGEVKQSKVQVEIARNERARGVEALSELENIRLDDEGAGRLLQIAAGNAERLLGMTAQGFRDRRDVVLFETSGRCVTAI